MNYNVVVPVTERNFQTLNVVIAHLRLDISSSKIILIGNRNIKEKCNIFKCGFIDEDELYEALTYGRIRKLIMQRDCYAGWRAGWYLQQFLKMSYSYVCQDEYYLVWDADTIPLRPISMFDDIGNPFFDVRDEYHRPYFTIMNKLFDNTVKKSNSYSYISEYMLINTEYMKEMIYEIENNHLLKGKNYYEKIINGIHEVDLMHSGFSEYETYGNYVNTHFPEKYKTRKLKALRNGDNYLHYPPTEKELNWAAQSYDIVTMENRHKIYSDVDVNINELIEGYSLEEVVRRHENRKGD